MTQWFNDTFTEASQVALTSHTSNSGHSWLFWAGAASPAPDVYTSFGGIVASGANGQVYRTSVIAPSADAVVSAVTYYDSSSNFTTIGICNRLNAGGTAGYLACYDNTSKTWQIHRVGASMSTTLLASSSVVNYVSGNTPALDFAVTGSGATVTLELKVDGAVAVTTTDTSGSRITAAGYAGVWFSALSANGIFFNSLSASDVVSAATAITISPTSGAGAVSVASSPFTIGANGTITGTVTVTPSDGGGGGAFSPTTVNISSGTPTATVTYTPGSTGSKSLTLTNNGSLTNPAAVTYTSTSGSATAINYSGPGSGTTGVASSAFTAAANGTLAASVIVTPSDGGAGGTFSPATVTLTTGSLSGTFTYTPGSVGAKTISMTNGGGLTNSPSSLSYTSLAASVLPPVLVKVADRVKETSTSAGAMSTITLAGAAAKFRRFQDVFAVGSQNIPICIEEQSGSAWMVASCTLTSATVLTVDAVISSSSGGATPTFGAGTKDIYCTMPAKMAFKARKIDLSDYAVDPTFVADSTPGIRQALQDAYDRRIEVIKCPAGHFKLSSALMGTGNCQVQVPQTREGAPNHSIYFEGVCAPNFEQQGLRNVAPPDNGTLFESTIAGSGTRPSVFGMEQGNPGDAWIWNYTNIGFSKLGIRTKVSGGANSMTAINCEYAAQVALLDQLRIDVDMGLIAAPTPNAASCGIIMPPVNNHLLLNGGMVYISGYYTGVVFGEHTKFDSLIVIGATTGIRLDSVYHGSWIGLYSAEHVKNAIVINGEHPLSIGHYDAEHNSSFAWGTFNADINKVSGTRKIAILRSTVVRAGAGYDESAFVSSDATIYKVLVGAGAN